MLIRVPASRWRPIALLLIIGCLTHNAVGAVFVGYDSAIHDRYLAGQPNSGFIIDESKITGISGDPSASTNRAHLVSPRHIITAAHTGEPTVRFRKSDGTFATYDVVSGAATAANPEGYVDLMTDIGGGNFVTSDVRLYRLTAPIPDADGIAPMSIFGGNAASLVGQEIFAMGQDNQAGRNVIKGIAFADVALSSQTVAHAFTFDTANNGGTDGLGDDEIRLQGGDSGHASLIQIGDEIVLLGAHIGVKASDPDFDDLFTSYSSLLSPYLGQINSIVQNDGFTITTATLIPEPSAPTVLAILGIAGAMRRRRWSHD